MGLNSTLKSPRNRLGIAGLLCAAGLALAGLGLRRATAAHWRREDRQAAARAASHRNTQQLRNEVLDGRR